MKKTANKIIKWLVSSRILLPTRRIVGGIFFNAISKKNGVVIFYNDRKRAKVLDLIRKIKTETQMLLMDNEAYQIFMAVKATEKIKGDIAEVGVYKGASAKLICEAGRDKSLHLFDTFEGLPDISRKDDPRQFQKGKFSASLEEVKNYLKKYQSVYFYKGIFPNSGGPVKNKKFSSVHLDVDLFESTLNSLKFFYPRMSRGGL